jgi:hypothetical protein
MADPPDPDTRAATRQTSWLVGAATIGSIVTGVFALLGGLYAFLSGQWQAAGVCLIAAAVAFGALANAVLRR